jgi:ubiquitin-large subunit ribosomal protein L40e
MASGGGGACMLPPIPKTVQVFIKVATTMATITLSVYLEGTVEDLKYALDEKIGLPPDQARIIYAGRQLEDGRTLAYYKIQKESTMFLVPRLHGD